MRSQVATSRHARSLTSTEQKRALLTWGFWLAILLVTAAGMFFLRSRLDKAHVALGFLLVVLGGSASGGRLLGVTLAVLAFLAFNVLFLPPYYTLGVAHPVDWLVLGAFLITGIVAAQLLSRAQERAAVARERAIEIERLAGEAERAEVFRQADALKTALIATVSHDLRTPLTTIKALARGLAERGHAEAASIEEEADRLNRFVADLLDLSRIAANAVPLQLEINDAGDLVGTALRRVRGAMNGREIAVIRDPAVPLFGTFDLVQSLRVLVNLLENALRYAPSGQPIELRVERHRDRLRFTVADRGPGVPPGEAELIFQPFYRPAGATPDVGGAGLGLAIARGLAAAQHGTVCYVPRDGGGSLFTFEVPAADPPVLDRERMVT
jgi:two-component system sensor histidine kinase KdpD